MDSVRINKSRVSVGHSRFIKFKAIQKNNRHTTAEHLV